MQVNISSHWNSCTIQASGILYVFSSGNLLQHSVWKQAHSGAFIINTSFQAKGFQHNKHDFDTLNCILNLTEPSYTIQICSESMLYFISFSCSILVWISESHRCTHTICNCNMAILTSFLWPKQDISFFRIIERCFYYLLPFRIEWTSCHPSIPSRSSECFNRISTFTAIHFSPRHTLNGLHSWFLIIFSYPLGYYFLVCHIHRG